MTVGPPAEPADVVDLASGAGRAAAMQGPGKRGPALLRHRYQPPHPGEVAGEQQRQRVHADQHGRDEAR